MGPKGISRVVNQGLARQYRQGFLPWTVAQDGRFCHFGNHDPTWRTRGALMPGPQREPGRVRAPEILYSKGIGSVSQDLGGECKVFVQPTFLLFSVQNPDICTPTENHEPSTVLDSVGISGSGISVVLHSWCFHHFLYNKTEFGSATASPEIARADPEIVDF